MSTLWFLAVVVYVQHAGSTQYYKMSSETACRESVQLIEKAQKDDGQLLGIHVRAICYSITQ